ncbi:M61 family peptidase [Dyella sp. A6]|uniref:M61 family metallopeptidase n=1 Tax=Dyella aluminiiresistens TaxID=3069105 RepID=UPI002E7630E4|nr:M61 family peptidase [Dyella sp. A6]
MKSLSVRFGIHALALVAACAVFVVCAAQASAPAAPKDTPYPGVLAITMDLRDAPHRIYRMHETIPVKPGPLTLYYPKWPLPDHAPDATIANIAGLTITADGRQLPWRRDVVDMYTLHVTVPQGIERINLSFQYLSPGPGAWYGYEVWSTPYLADLDPTQVVFYPSGYYARDIPIRPTVVLPTGWKFATAMDVTSRSGDTIHFKRMSFNNFIDSPLIAGKYFKRVDLSPGDAAPVHLNIVGDSAASVQISDTQVAAYRRMVKQLYALFHSHHFHHYDLLLTVSDHVAGTGLEHHQSSMEMAGADFLTNPDAFMASATLIPHEFTHSWNGKFRRPADMWTPAFNTPQPSDMVWAYEGLTEYWSVVLAARSGLLTPAEFRESLASVDAAQAYRTGRAWRSLQDTATSAQLLYFNGSYWSNYRRSTDFYPEGELLWLGVDTKIRQLSHNRRSLDDFAKLFYGMDNGSYVTRTYTFHDLVDALNQVQPFDWASFLRKRLDYTGKVLPEHGIARGGWKVVYTNAPSAYDQAVSRSRHRLDLAYSIGMTMSDDGTVSDVQWNGPAYKAGLVPGMKVVSVNGNEFTGDALKAAIRQAQSGTSPIELAVKYVGTYSTHKVDYHGGLKYPHLERVNGTPDYLDDIARAKAN